MTFREAKDRFFAKFLSKDKQILIDTGIAPKLHWEDFNNTIAYIGYCNLEISKAIFKEAEGNPAKEHEADVFYAWGQILLTPANLPHGPHCEQVRKFVKVFFDELDEEQQRVLQYNLENDKNIADLKRQILVIMAQNYDSLWRRPQMGVGVDKPASVA